MAPAAYFSMPTRAWQFAAGGLVALTAGQWRRLLPLPAVLTGWTGLALILLACIQLSSATPYPGRPRCCPHWVRCWQSAPAVPDRLRGAASWDPRRCGRSGGCHIRGTCGTGRCWCSRRHCCVTCLGWPPSWQRFCCLAGWRRSHYVSLRIRCDSPLACAVLRVPVWRLAVPPPRSRSAWAWFCRAWFCREARCLTRLPAALRPRRRSSPGWRLPRGLQHGGVRRGGAACVR